MTDPAEPTWMTFDEVSAFLTMPEEELARLLLAGFFNFEVDKRSPAAGLVVRMDLRIAADGVREYQRMRWDTDRLTKADDLINRAAMKFGKHPTRTTPGVRGSAKTKESR